MKELIEKKWNEILGLLETQYEISKIIIDTWISSLEIYDVDKNIIYFCPDEKKGQFGVEFLKKKGYDQYLLSSIREVLNSVDIDIVIDEKENYINSANEKDGEYQNLPNNKAFSKSYYEAVEKSNLNSKYTFENFVVGESNKHAYATCLAVADLPAQDIFNPLFLYGGPGLGKTHLMQSIAHYILQHNPSTKVLYVTSEIFTTEIIDAIRNNKTHEFREKYRQVDVLLIDDIQEIIGKDSTQQEFFNTFNYLYEAKKQIIISSDKPPKEIKTLEERLRSRFEWGVPIDIHAPDYETRMAILKTKAEMSDLNIPEDVFKYIATNIVSNVRELEGALNKISVFGKLMNKEITVELAKDTLRDIISSEEDINITPEFILSIVSEHMNVSTDDICSKKRSADIAIARQLVMYLCRTLTDKSLQSIGSTVGGKDHATVYNGIKRIEEKLADDPSFKSTIDVIIKKINPKE